MELGHFEGMIAYVHKGDEAAELYAAGWHDRAIQIPTYPEAYFKIASVGMLYVATTVTKMIGDGMLDLDQTLGHYMPELVGRIENAKEITLRHMIGHRSGIPNYTDTENYWSDPKKSFEENLDLILDEPANFEPGENYQYCNTNYLLLDEIMNRVLGYSNFEYLKKEVLRHLGLKNTYPSNKNMSADSLMSGYYVGYEEDLKSDVLGIVATAEDVGVCLRALNEGTFFTAEEQELYSSIYVYDHTGLVPGYQTIAEYHEDSNTVIILFANTTDFQGYQWSYGRIAHQRIMKIIKSGT